MPSSLATELLAAYTNRELLAPPSARDGGLDLATAYAVEREIVASRRASGARTVGLKVGYANKAMWRVLGLETLVWAHMYDDTVRHAAGNSTTLSLADMVAPKIEPEIVFRMKRPLDSEGRAALDGPPTAVLDAVEWLALGFEIVDCVYADWKFQPADFVAARGLHAALIVGEPVAITPTNVATIAEQLPRFKLRLTKNGEPAAEGSGKNSLRSPALCLAELAAALARDAEAEPLAAGDLVSTGSLTDAPLIAAGETWTASVDGLELPPLTLHTT